MPVYPGAQGFDATSYNGNVRIRLGPRAGGFVRHLENLPNRFNVPIRPDKDGYLGREFYGVFGWCPDCGAHNSVQILA